MSINCRVSFKNNALEVVDKNGQPSKLYYDALALTGNEDKAIDLWYKAFSQEFTEQVRLNKDDVTLDEVLKFVSANSSFGKSLEPAEIRSIKDIMDKNSFETLSDLYKTLVGIFKPQGIIELDTVKAYQSGLFDLQGLSEINLNEIDDILDKVEGTLRVTDIYVAPSSDNSASFIDTSRKTILGTPEFISQEDIEQEIVNNVESTKDLKEISSYINNLPYSSFADRFNTKESFRTSILNNLGKYTKVNTLFIVDGRPTTKNLNYYKSLVNTISDRNNTKGLIADFEFLSDIDEVVWSQNQDDIKEVLREIEKDQFTENGIDIFGISKFSSNKFLVIDTLNSLGEMLNNTTNETIFNFAEKFTKTVSQQSSITSELLPESLEPYSENIFRVDSALNDSELFRKFGLLKVSDNIYHKVDLGARSNLYEELYQQAKETGYPITINSEDKEASLRDLEKYVLLQDSTVEKDIREEYILNKIIFNHPKTQDTNDYSQLSDITTDTEYLVRGFARDFNDYIVIEKQADSQVYRDTLSKFRVSDSGVSLAFPIKSIEGLEFERELTDYIRLKKDQSMKYLLPSRPTNLKSRFDLQAINNPASVLNYSRQYAFDNGLLVTEKVSDNYVNFFGNTYAKVAEDSTNSVFKAVPKNLDANYYVTNTDFITSEDKENATQALNDAKFSFTNSTLTEQEFDKSIEDAGIKNEVKFTNNPVLEQGDNILNQFNKVIKLKQKEIKILTELIEKKYNNSDYVYIPGHFPSSKEISSKERGFEYGKLLYKNIEIANDIYPAPKSWNEYSNSKIEPNSELFTSKDTEDIARRFKENLSYLNDLIKSKVNFINNYNNILSLRKETQLENYSKSSSVPKEVSNSATEVLKINFKSYLDLSNDINALPLIANIANMYAKTIDNTYYDNKDIITQFLAKNHPGAWSMGDGILYIETPQGQVSFHVFSDQDTIALKYGLDPFGRKWSEEEVQFISESLLKDYIEKNNITRNFTTEQLDYLDEITKRFEKNKNLKSIKNILYQKNKSNIIGQASIKPGVSKLTVETVIEKLKQTGLASRVNQMSPDEIYERLSSLGVNLTSKKQISDKNTINKEELAQDYFTREADRLPLTLAVFNRPEFVKMQGKNVNRIAVLNSLNQSGIKQIEKDLIRSVIENYYKDQTKVSYDEVEATVRANIMPLEVLNTDSYSNYGMDNLSNGDYGDANTIIFNSPIEHGVVGHFSSSFTSKNREALKYVPKQLNNNTWVAVQEGYENQANGNDIYQYVGTAGTQEDVDTWIAAYNNSSDTNDESTINKGMFGHIRVWTDGDIYNVAELQSDYFQKNNAKREIANSKYEKAKELALQERKEGITKDLNEVVSEMYEMGLPTQPSSSQLTNFGIGNIPLTVKLKSQQDNVRSNREYDAYEQEIETIKNKTRELYVKYKQLLEDLNKSDYLLTYEKDQKFIKLLDTKVQELLTPQERQFIASQKEWEKRMVREALRLASSSGASKLRLPTPHTLSVIEGYLSEDGGMPYEIENAQDSNRLEPGDTIYYAGEEYTVLKSWYENIEVAQTDYLYTIEIDSFIEEQVSYEVDEIMDSQLGIDITKLYTQEEWDNEDKYSALEDTQLEDLGKEIEDGVYELSETKIRNLIEEDKRDYYNSESIESIIEDMGYENVVVKGDTAYYTQYGKSTETFGQPDTYDSQSDKESFTIEGSLDDTQQTVARKYEEIASILKKEVGEENVKIVTDNQGFDWYETDVEDKYSNKAVVAFQKQLSEQGIKPIVNGFVYNNEVFLNKDTITEETPIHEFNHLFTDWMKSNRPSLYNKGIELVKEELSKEDSDIASVINYVKQTQPDLAGEKLFEEILTELTGKEGAALIESGKKSGILDWLRSFFKEIGNMLGILDATPEQVANMTAREFAKSSAVQLLKGDDILAKAMNLRDSISYASMFGSVYSPVNDTVDSVAEELRACN